MQAADAPRRPALNADGCRRLRWPSPAWHGVHRSIPPPSRLSTGFQPQAMQGTKARAAAQCPSCPSWLRGPSGLPRLAWGPSSLSCRGCQASHARHKRSDMRKVVSSFGVDHPPAPTGHHLPLGMGSIVRSSNDGPTSSPAGRGFDMIGRRLPPQSSPTTCSWQTGSGRRTIGRRHDPTRYRRPSVGGRRVRRDQARHRPGHPRAGDADPAGDDRRHGDGALRPSLPGGERDRRPMGRQPDDRRAGAGGALCHAHREHLPLRHGHPDRRSGISSTSCRRPWRSMPT